MVLVDSREDVFLLMCMVSLDHVGLGVRWVVCIVICGGTHCYTV